MILLGTNSSGLIHYGNYLSIIKPVFFLNKKKIFLADLHCMSKKIFIKNIIKNKILIIFVFLSFFKSLFYYQSYNKNFLKLFWYILCFYKKNKTKFFHCIKKKKKYIVSEILYPLLMSSDIISNNNSYIFVGIDQLQHIEIYKKILKKINYYSNLNIDKKKIIVNNKILYSYDKKKMSKSNKNDLFIYSNKNEIKLFFNKFTNTKKKKKSLLNFSLNIINNLSIINVFLKNTKKKFIKYFLNLIYYKFYYFRKKFFFNLKNNKNVLNSLNLNNKFSNIINNKNNNFIYNKINI